MSQLRNAPLGPREVGVMDRLWDEARPLSVREVHRMVGAPRGLSSKTIHSTLERLVRKGLASRERSGRAYVYRATGTRRAWIADVFDALAGDLGEANRAEVLAGFVEFAERTSASTLEALQTVVGARLAARGEEEDC